MWGSRSGIVGFKAMTGSKLCGTPLAFPVAFAVGTAAKDAEKDMNPESAMTLYMEVVDIRETEDQVRRMKVGWLGTLCVLRVTRADGMRACPSSPCGGPRSLSTARCR